MAGILEMLEFLPQLLTFAQMSFYLLMAWFFGSMAFKGLKTHVSFPIKIFASLAVGFICLIVGISFSNYLPFSEEPIFELLQIDLLAGGLISSVMFAIAFYMITRKTERADKDSLIMRLTERNKLLEGLLVSHKVPTLKEKRVREIAESIVHGYRSESARHKGEEWEVTLAKGKSKAKIVLGAYTGEMKSISYERSKAEALLSDPFKIAGLIIIIGFMVFAVFNFRGFPSMTDGIARLMGMEPEQFNALINPNENIPEGCVSASKLLMKHGINIGGLPPYEDESLKNMIEQETGRQVVLMYETEDDGNDYVVAITLPLNIDLTGLSNQELIQNSDICSATKTRLCDCLKISEMSIPTGFMIAR